MRSSFNRRQFSKLTGTLGLLLINGVSVRSRCSSPLPAQVLKQRFLPPIAFHLLEQIYVERSA